MINAGIAESMATGQTNVEIEAEALTIKIERERREDVSNVVDAGTCNVIVEGEKVVVQATRGLLNQVNHLQNQVGIERRVGNHIIINLQEDTREDGRVQAGAVHRDLTRSIHIRADIEKKVEVKVEDETKDETEVEAEAAVHIQEPLLKIRR
jgi:hypothetical protein